MNLRKTLSRALASAVLFSEIGNAAELDPLLQRLATCKDSWLDWQRDDASMERFVEALEKQFRRDEKKRIHVPRSGVRFLGHPVTEVIPQNMGIGLGFGVTLKAPMADVRPNFEQAIGKKFEMCQADGGLTTCAVEIGPRKTAMLVAPTDRPEIGTQVGCFYNYQR